ncbi:Hypothetical predicted protein [Mytilus galloprovincialis]|uniref:LRAT domain-containing protein n=1 Tax=Mytilus galloprovincialis TaxID=29158 RepID=A0A8B6FNE0_MYTGA|nr:Hypothetical predicted protein [Mytilus galloprovincialis]
MEMASLRAFYRRGEAEYSLTSNNCESFVTWVLTGEAKCEQFEKSGAGKRILMDIIESGIDHRNKVIAAVVVPVEAAFCGIDIYKLNKQKKNGLISKKGFNRQVTKKVSGSASSVAVATGTGFLGAFIGQIVCPIPVVGGVIGGAVGGVVGSLAGRATGSAVSGKIFDAVTD